MFFVFVGGLVSKEAMQSPLNTQNVVELPFTTGCYHVAYCGEPGTFNSLVVDYYKCRPDELIQGHVINVSDLMVCLFSIRSRSNCSFCRILVLVPRTVALYERGVLSRALE